MLAFEFGEIAIAHGTPFLHLQMKPATNGTDCLYRTELSSIEFNQVELNALLNELRLLPLKTNETPSTAREVN